MDELEHFLSEPDVEIPPMDFSIADRYGQLVADLRRKGTPIPTNDIWIAATALENGARLLTADRHFERIDGLMLFGLDG
jgi:tRNA(fMet)-specific endonuclease VapC